MDRKQEKDKANTGLSSLQASGLDTGFQVRTDLAVEERESFPGDGGEIRGVSLEEAYEPEADVKISRVVILDEEGAKAMRKPVGTYVTLEAEHMSQEDGEYHREIAAVLARELEALLPKKRKTRVLAVGLGNQELTADSLGPRVLGNLKVTRHLLLEYGEAFGEKYDLPDLWGLAPGVMAQTGMETAEILKGIIAQTKPDAVIAIDALAARSVRRLGTTIQLTDTGIHPGAGVGNHRNSLTRESLGVPVLAIGVPTVVGAAAIVHDTIGALIGTLEGNESTKGAAGFLKDSAPEEQYALIRELLEPEFGPMYVTPKDIDATVKQLSYTISEGIHIALYGADPDNPKQPSPQ